MSVCILIRFFFPSPISLPCNISCVDSVLLVISCLSYKIPKSMIHLEQLSCGNILTFADIVSIFSVVEGVLSPC